MSLRLLAREGAITRCIDSFSPQYHRDYAEVRRLAKDYLSPACQRDQTKRLAVELHRVLLNWGAGRRRAPAPRSAVSIASRLQCQTLRSDLKALADSCSQGLSLSADGIRLINGKPFDGTGFDESLFSVLQTSSQSMLEGNTSVTYPMKILLLLTGLMPAYDSQVRRGMHAAGLRGMTATQYLMPKTMTCSGWKRLAMLPFLVGHCWTSNAARFENEINNSKYPALSGDPGRVFDVIFFMHTNDPVLQYDGKNDWYRF
jgi:hypothetical protein